jgi:hypothetical protein
MKVARDIVKMFREQKGGVTKFLENNWEHEIAKCAHKHVPKHTPEVFGVVWATDMEKFGMGMETLDVPDLWFEDYPTIKEDDHVVQLLRCLKQMHDVGIIHNDTRLGNVGFRDSVACFFDFGQSYVLPGSVADRECPNAPHNQTHLWDCSFEEVKSRVLEAEPEDAFNYLRMANVCDLPGKEGDIIQLMMECSASNRAAKKMLHTIVSMKENGCLSCEKVINEYSGYQ